MFSIIFYHHNFEAITKDSHISHESLVYQKCIDESTNQIRATKKVQILKIYSNLLDYIILTYFLPHHSNDMCDSAQLFPSLQKITTTHVELANFKRLYVLRLRGLLELSLSTLMTCFLSYDKWDTLVRKKERKDHYIR